jgi:hypothetical protein
MNGGEKVGGTFFVTNCAPGWPNLEPELTIDQKNDCENSANDCENFSHESEIRA